MSNMSHSPAEPQSGGAAIHACTSSLNCISRVDELMGDMESAALLYSKAVRLIVFLLVEAPSLILNPPFSLTNSDRYRLRTYIDIIRGLRGWPFSSLKIKHDLRF
ncbi:hypothetical protein Q3G72_034931 [Acer saccharum]|nr:hypothetical protein Q3G72_034931 [Acer saccharum]